MSKKKEKAEPSLRPEISRELDKGKLAKRESERFMSGGSPREGKALEQLQRCKIREAQRKLLKDTDIDKHRKADKKIGGVRGKFHPSLERTRKRT
ncbi:MAG: hypothetical protein SWQ30_20220 [Thermodesulfobacteriota bacterium]|nr:hypothetical protein [Thermodesulfobacteriota bacterium]